MISYIESKGHDPYRNLAIEECLLNLCDDGPVLYLWQNERTVVIGRNQDPKRECRTDLLEAEGGHLARRLSGGGAVYHDLGNLNFSFIARREDYDTAGQLDVIRHAMNGLGIKAVFSGRNDLEIDGRKFSGSAFYECGGRCCHHGTIMVDVDGDAMARYLMVSDGKLKSKGVASVHARVVSLKELLPGIIVGRVKDALLAAFEDAYGTRYRKIDESALDTDKIRAIESRFRDPAWIYGRFGECGVNPPSGNSAGRTRRFKWGEVSVRLNVENGIVTDAAVHSDAMETDWAIKAQSALIGIKHGEIAGVLENCPMPAEIKRDLAAWIYEWDGLP